MDKGVRKLHTDSEYESELRRVRDNILRMAGCVEEMIKRSVDALVARDVEAANAVIDSDARVNQYEVDTDELCLLILAKRQPLASDLRFITLAMKMVTDIERIGDLAVNICERTLALDELPPATIPPTIQQMSDAAQQMVREAISSFIETDADMAMRVWELDSTVDEQYLEVCNSVQSQMSGGAMGVERGMHIQAVAKFLERIGDHATNLAELVVFMVRGTDVRHEGKLMRR